MNLKNSLTNLAYKGKYAVADHSSQLLTGATILGSVGAFTFAIVACVKKLPQIQADFDAAIEEIQNNISTPYQDAKEELSGYTDEEIAAVLSDTGEDEETIRNRSHIEALITVNNTGLQCEAAAVTKAKLVRVGRIALAFLPAILCLGGSIFASITMLTKTLKAAAIAGATIAGLTTELAATRKDLKEAIGEEAMSIRDRDNTIKEIEGSSTEADEFGIAYRQVEQLRKQLYTRVYDAHLIQGMSIEDCLKDAQSDLLTLETIKNHQFHDRGRMYYGDILMALYKETNECGQNTGWITRDYPNEYDGYIDFGCWIVDPTTGVKSLNPANINPDGTITLNFNVEGPVEWMLQEAKKKGAAFRKSELENCKGQMQLLPQSV